MHIDSYEFGHVVIDGVGYDGDLLIIAGVVRPNWWRKQGHLLQPDDLQAVLDAKPAALIVGCGASGMMRISPAVRQRLSQSDIKIEAHRTARAVERINELIETGEEVAAALHLTC